LADEPWHRRIHPTVVLGRFATISGLWYGNDTISVPSLIRRVRGDEQFG
jgi:hypothetical protein